MSAAFARQNEPSMDDILASIRKIISDDIGGSGQSSDDASASNPGSAVLELLPETALSRATHDWNDRSGVSDSAKPAPISLREPNGSADPAPVRMPIAQHFAPESSSFGSAPIEQAGTSEAERVVSAAFTSLRQSLDEQAAPRVDLSSATQLIVEATLRPMLKEWLDANLPVLVERLVSAEIERMARRG